MVQFDKDESTQCAVYDFTPASEQKKINIVVRPSYTVSKVFSDITTQYHYDRFELVLQPISKSKDLIYLNDCKDALIYKVAGFQPSSRNVLILMPPGEWDGNVKKRYPLSLSKLKSADSINGAKVDAAKHMNDNEKTTNKNTSSNHIHTNNNNGIINSSSIKKKHVNDAINDDVGGIRRIGAINIDLGVSITGNPYMMTMSSDEPCASSVMNDDTPTTPPPASGPGSTTDSLNLSPLSEPEPLSDDDLALGASASPTEIEPMNGEALSLAHTSPNGSRSKFSALSEDAYMLYQNDNTHMQPSSAHDDDDGDLRPSTERCRKTARKAALTLPTSNSNNSSTTSTSIGYRGLVNQAMTCYLNSLLQALFMTPEFRNALYRWEFDNDSESKNIPYQLQKLFLNLQTSKKSAVETTYLTRSFGWDSTEAWQQHDIQELCRVMFDALEHKFRNTKQANLISTLYEGKMIDYVKCLECQTEKARIDTFLDIPLPVRPFGSTVAYGSIEEALRAFVQPETLNGNNQYFCEKCNKKCDAHKGLKFKTFPYILTLHLKRFDFDYQTMHRIKLNDKVTFPQTLNLNTFVSFNEAQNGVSQLLNGVTTTDDCSTTDSGSAMEEDNCSSGVVTTASSSQHENDMNDEDEGIDMSTSTDHRINPSESIETSLKHETGPYSYELFAIMIHSGSASGGHYYAYIKEFENNEWFCFNDQSVTAITEEDIHKSFGGSSSKGYYTSAYTSSTNAYMLMYRQIDTKRNEHVMKVEDFPEHINALLPKLNSDDEMLRSNRISRYECFSDLALHSEPIKPRVYFYNSELKKLKLTRVYVSRKCDLNSVLESAYPILNVDKFAPITRCRLVDYDASSEEIIQSFENAKDTTLSEIRATTDALLDFLLEYRAEGQEFETYAPGGATWYVYVVVVHPTMEMDGPHLVYSLAHENTAELRRSISTRLHVDEKKLLLATLPNKKAFVAYDPMPTKEAEDRLSALAKARFRNLTYFYLYVPKTDPCYLEIMGIPAYEQPQPKSVGIPNGAGTGGGCGDVVDAVLMNGCGATVADSSTSCGLSPPSTGGSTDSQRESPLPPPTAMPAQESNSEDSSLSDGDRTLVESLPQCRPPSGGDSQVSSSSSSSTHSPQLSSPDEEATQDSYNRITAYLNRSTHPSDFGDMSSLSNHRCPAAPAAMPFFHAIELKSFDAIFDTSRDNLSTTSTSASTSLDDEMSRKHAYKIIVDSHMKVGEFQQHIESLIRVPANYFKIQRKHGSSETVSSEKLLLYYSEGETLMVDLGKALQPNEHKSKIFFMRLSDLDNETGRLPCICEWIYNTSMTVADAKKDLIQKLHRIDAKYQTLTLANCRLWLKGGRNPIKIMRDEESLANDIRTSAAVDFLVQECEDNINPQPDENSMTLFVRQWHADTLQLDKFQEITLEKDSEMKNVLSKLSGLPEDHIAYCKINSAFPCTTISLLSVNSSMSWFSIAATMDNYPLSTTINGNVYFYKDVTKAPKELSTEERRDWSVKEKSRLDQLGGVSTSLYSPRRERALKIYVDSPSPPAAMDTSNVSTNVSASSSAVIAKDAQIN